MTGLPHTAIYTDNQSFKEDLTERLLKGSPPEALSFLHGLTGAVFSNTRIATFLEEEARHEKSGILPQNSRKLATFSSGERKRALLTYLLSQFPDYLILDNAFDNLDRKFQKELKDELHQIGEATILIQFLSRPADLLSFIQQKSFLDKSELKDFPDYDPLVKKLVKDPFKGKLPPAPSNYKDLPKVLIELKDVHLNYGENQILKGIDWNLKPGEFWELRGANGSGKTSLITMINGDNPKAYGQDIYLFGKRKGSGESVWEIKEKIGYFTPAMTDRFRGYHSVENMLISGLTDSIGLYQKPTDRQRLLAGLWLDLLGYQARKGALFKSLTQGQQRLLMCARAMIKHPPLLILDEPTAGLDETTAALVVGLVRKMAGESKTAIVFVSHREEPGLKADKILELIPSPCGSSGLVKSKEHK